MKNHFTFGSRPVITMIYSSIIFNDEVNIMKNKTIEIVFFSCFFEANVQQLGSVEKVTINLVDQKYFESDVLPDENRNHMMKENVQLLRSD